MTIGNVIATYRKNMGLTQDGLAQQLGVTNQAVSKWESDQSCPDILLLPQIADIFGITIDALFGREKPQAEPAEPAEPAPVQTVEVNDLPWPDDDTLRIVMYKGHNYLASCPEQENITLEYDGPALNVDCAVNLTCNEVSGNVRAGGDVTCDTVNGSVDAGGSVTCDDVMGNLSAGGDVTCDAVDGNVNAGGDVSCDSVEGNVNAGKDVTCDEVEGNIFAGRDVTCDEVSGSVTAGGTVTTGEDDQGHFHFKGKKKGRIHISVEDRDDQGCGSDCQEDCESCEHGGFSCFNGSKTEKKGKKNHHIHITVDGDENTEDAAEEEDIGEKIEGRIEKFVNDIIRRSTNFRP